MGTEILQPFLTVLLMVLALFAASYSASLFSKRHDVLASSIFGMCVGTFVMLMAILVGWRLFYA